MDHQSEIELIYQLITHPAGFNVGNSCVLGIYQLEGGAYAISWENWVVPSELDPPHWEELIIPNALQAVQCFVELRHKMLIGLDLEEQVEPRTDSHYRLTEQEIADIKTRYDAR